MLAAGMGKRLKEFTKDNTKCMVKVNGEMLIDRVVSLLSRLNVSRLVVVTGYKGEALRQHLESIRGDLEIEYVTIPNITVQTIYIRFGWQRTSFRKRILCCLRAI